MIRQAILGALGAVSLAIPGIVSAQTYQGQDYGYGYTDRGYHDQEGGWRNPDRGDYDNGYGRYGYSRFNGYPEFRGLEQHIRSEIIQGMRDDTIDRDGAQDLFNRLRAVKTEERREFQVHGWRLPQDDRYRIRSAYERLDREVDRIREEPEG